MQIYLVRVYLNITGYISQRKESLQGTFGSRQVNFIQIVLQYS